MPQGLHRPGSTCFILTNTRGLSEDAAVAMNSSIGRDLFALAEGFGTPLDVVSRSDSTLRGHVVAEVRALDAARVEATGKGFDGVLLAPSYFEAGRITVGDVHWARIGGELVPVGATEFAQDATFGYASSNLRDFVAEKSQGTITAQDVVSISLNDIRLGGPARVSRDPQRGQRWRLCGGQRNRLRRPRDRRTRPSRCPGRGQLLPVPDRSFVRPRPVRGRAEGGAQWG